MVKGFLLVALFAVAAGQFGDSPDSLDGIGSRDGLDGGALEGIQPVADDNPSYLPAADHLDEEQRPPDALGGSGDRDLGAVETLSSAPSEEMLARIQAAANEGDLDELRPPPGNARPPASRNLVPAPEMKRTHSRGFDSRATVAFDTANKAIERAKRAAEEARLAISAAEAAKKEADEVVRRGGDGGPAVDAQGLLALDERGVDPTAAPPDDDDGRDAAELGLPNPNPPSLRRHELPTVVAAQLDARTLPSGSARGLPRNENLDLRKKLIQAVSDPPAIDMPAGTQRHDEGEGDEEEFKHHHHHRHHRDKDNHVKLRGDSSED